MIELLTRRGCANTTIMKRNLDEAIARMTPRAAYVVIDLDQLPQADQRRAYPTPTILYSGSDIFGLPEPSPPYPEPS